ncbi:MAG TPA: sigma-70 family RNA polymerase sigma factor [Thermoanaerobaculia bacterium]|jgi:RNA polymerase sigma factor (sigma-70 family)
MAAMTRLQQVIEMHGLKPLQIVREAQRLAAALERPAISRQHFLRCRTGRAAATEDKIYIIVAAMRSLTGLLFRPTDLFELEPPVGGLHPRTDSVRRSTVSQESGATDRFESLYTEYGLLLRTIAMRRYHVPPDDAEALVHDIFAAYLERSGYVRDAKGWLIGAIGNASCNYIRKRRPEAQLLPEHEEAIDEGTEERIEGWMRHATITAMLSRLGDKCRETLRRYYLREESKEAIAEHLDTSPAYVLQLLVTCRKRAQEILQNLSRRKE